MRNTVFQIRNAYAQAECFQRGQHFKICEANVSQKKIFPSPLTLGNMTKH